MSDMWESVSEAWASNADFVDGHLAEPTRRMLDLAEIGSGSEVLDLACGPGGAGMAAASRVGPSGSVVFADDAPGMVAAAANRSKALNNVSTLVCSQESISVEDETFDAVIIRHGLMFAEDKAAAVGEAVRVLRPGHRYAAMTWGPRQENPWLSLTLDSVAEEFGVPFPPPEVLGPFELDDPDTLKRVLEDGGLLDVGVEKFEAPAAFDSVEAWCDLIPQLAGPLAIALEGMEPEVRDSIRDRALEFGHAAAEELPDGIRMSGSVLIGYGRRT